MTTLLEHALRQLRALPEPTQDRVARRLLAFPELAEPQGASPSLMSLIETPEAGKRSKVAIDRQVEELRDGWEQT